MPQFETGSAKLSISSIIAPQQTRVTTADDVNNLLGTVAKTTDDMVKVVDNETMTDKSRRYNEARAAYQKGLETANGDPFATNEVWSKFKADTQALIDEGGFISEESKNKLQGTIINEISQRELYHNNMQRQYLKEKFKDGLTEQLVMDSSNMEESYKRAQEIAKIYNITDMNEISETIVSVLKNKAKVELLGAGDSLSKEMLDAYDTKLKDLAKIDKKLEGKPYYVEATSTIETFRNQYNATGKELIKHKIATDYYVGNPKALQADMDKYDFSASTKEVLTLSNQANTKAFYEKQYSETVQAILMNPEPSAKDRATANRLMKQLGKSQEYIDSFNARLDHKEDTNKDALANKLFDAAFNSASIGIDSGQAYDPKALSNLMISAKEAVVTEDGQIVPVSKKAQEMVVTNEILFKMQNDTKYFMSSHSEQLPGYTRTAVKAFADKKVDELYKSTASDKMDLIAQIYTQYGASGLVKENIQAKYKNPDTFEQAYAEYKWLAGAIPNSVTKMLGEDTIEQLELYNKLKSQAGKDVNPIALYEKVEKAVATTVDFNEPRVKDAYKEFNKFVSDNGIADYSEQKKQLNSLLKLGYGAEDAVKQLKDKRKLKEIGAGIDMFEYPYDLNQQQKEHVKTLFNYLKDSVSSQYDGLKYHPGTQTMWLSENGFYGENTGLSFSVWAERTETLRQKDKNNKQVLDNKAVREAKEMEADRITGGYYD